ncbi:MAG: TonB-dependent receptor, partial [Bacteroidota bacterium]|nr:TonB-dependent receptor [Bacteroidota bacterium]
MRKFITLFVLNAICLSGFAQFPAGGRPGGGAQNLNMGHFYGKIVDSGTHRGLESITVQLLEEKYNPATKKSKETIKSAFVTKANGEFSFDNLNLLSKYKLVLSSLGYKTKTLVIGFSLQMPQGGAANAMGGGAQAGGGGGAEKLLGMIDKDLGNISMEEDASNLGNVTVTSSAKPQFELGIDRKIFNVDKNLVSTGQTATEIMKNIPSLNVDIDGNVTLRNATPTIFIDDRPTTLTLDQIPADIIEKVEIITNPSAKYDASGGNAGILNIVLKKNKKTGYNGGFRTGVDSRGKINLGGDLNLRQNKINITLNGMYNQRKSISNGLTDRNNLLATPSNVYNTSDGTNNGFFGFFRGGVDYLIDNRNTLSV